MPHPSSSPNPGTTLGSTGAPSPGQPTYLKPPVSPSTPNLSVPNDWTLALVLILGLAAGAAYLLWFRQ